MYTYDSGREKSEEKDKRCHRCDRACDIESYFNSQQIRVWPTLTLHKRIPLCFSIEPLPKTSFHDFLLHLLNKPPLPWSRSQQPHTLGVRGPGNRQKHLEYIAGSG